MKKTFSCDDENRKKLAEAYLFGGMSKNRRQAFEEHYKTCDLCYEALLEAQKLLAEMRDAARKAGWNKRELEQLSRLYSKQSFFRDINWRLTLFIAGVLFVAVFVPLLWWTHKTPVTMASFVHLQRESAIDPTLSEEPEILNRALELHVQGRDREVIDILEDGMQAMPRGDARRYAAGLQGLSWLFLKEPVKAIPLLNRASAAKSGWLYERTVWYLANAYLLLENKKMAILYLNKVILMHGAHEKHAASILERLEALAE